MAPSKKSKSKPGPRGRNSNSINRSPLYKTPLSSQMQHMIPPIAILTPNFHCDRAWLNKEFPLSCARDEPGTKPLLEPFSIPLPPPPTTKRGKKSQSKKARSAAKFAANIQTAKIVQDPKNIPNNSLSTSGCQVVEKAKVKRKKIQVQKSCRVLRSRGRQPSVKQELLDGGTIPSPMRLIQDKENDDSHSIPDWEASWNKWNHIRGTIRRPK